MRRRISIHLGSSTEPFAELLHDKQGARESGAFVYSESWLSHSERFEIEPALPLVTGPQFAKKSSDRSVFHGAIRDTEPDGWARRVILREHAKRREAVRAKGGSWSGSPLSELDFLLAVDDESRMGALRFCDENGVFQGTTANGVRKAPPLVELAQLLKASHAVERSEDTAADVAYLLGRGTSLGGLRPKCSVVDDDGHLAIGKFPSTNDERAVTRAEVLVLRLASLAGIDAAQARIVDSAGAPVAVIRRFDRTLDGKRIPYMSAATLLGAGSDDSAEHAYTEIVDALRIHGSQAQADIEELFRRIAFSIAVNNVDDHLHNHGFLYVAHGHWRLSPAFDINPFPERARELKTWISEESGPAASFSQLLAIASYFALSDEQARAIIEHVLQRVQTWHQVGVELGMSKAELDGISEAFEGAPPLP